jgi:anti-sigma factor RsiW
MRCSSSEARLDAYVEGTLPPRERALVAAHVAACPACATLLEEFRVIDALLVTPRTLEPAPNFTFKVMAEVRALPQPHVHRTPALAVLATYVAFAWAALGAFFFFARGAALAAFAALDQRLVLVERVFSALASATGHVFGSQTFDVTAAMGGLLALDVLAAAALFGGYALLRTRRSGAAGTDGEPC